MRAKRSTRADGLSPVNLLNDIRAENPRASPDILGRSICQIDAKKRDLHGILRADFRRIADVILAD
jgi:hypothetical protein